MNRASRIGWAAGGVALIGGGLLSNHWWSIDFGAAGGLARELGGSLVSGSVGLRNAEACVATICQEIPLAAMGGGRGLTGMLMLLTFWGGLGVLGLLVASTAARELRGESGLARVAGTACVALLVCACATVVMGMATASGGASLMPSYAGFVLVAGCVAGAYSVRSDSSAWEGSGAAPVLARSPAPSAAPLSSTSPARQLSHDLDGQVRAASRVAPVMSAKAARREGASAVADASIDAVRTSLRFVASSIELREDALVAVVDNVPYEVAFGDITQVVARRLPPDPPFDGVVLVDLITAARPIRILPSTAGNYSALPGPSSVRAIDNLRKLGAAIEAKHASVIEPRSRGFFLEGKQPEAFAAVKQFVAYDATLSAS